MREGVGHLDRLSYAGKMGRVEIYVATESKTAHITTAVERPPSFPSAESV